MTDFNIDFGIWGSIFPVPCAVADRHLKLCTGTQLKVLLLALREGKSPVDLEGAAKRLGITPAEASDCLDYWREAGIFAPGGSPLPQAPPKAEAAPAGGSSRPRRPLRPLCGRSGWWRGSGSPPCTPGES